MRRLGCPYESAMRSIIQLDFKNRSLIITGRILSSASSAPCYQRINRISPLFMRFSDLPRNSCLIRIGCN